MNFTGTWTTRDGRTAVITRECLPPFRGWAGLVDDEAMRWEMDGRMKGVPSLDLIERRREGVGQ